MKTFVLISLLAVLVGNTYSNVTLAINHKHVSKLEIQVESIKPSTEKANDGNLKIRIIGGTPPYNTQVLSSYLPAQTYKKDYIEISNIGVGNYVIIVQDHNKQIVQNNMDIIAKK